MYTTTSAPVPAPMNGMGNNRIDGSGTINPADLNSPISLPASSLTSSTPVTADDNTSNLNLTATTLSPSANSDNNNTISRGVKRSRSVDQYADHPEQENAEEDGRRKRGRPPKMPRASGNPPAAPVVSPQRGSKPSQSHLNTPQSSSDRFSHSNPIHPAQMSPPARTTPTKPVLKALPTVRDHTTDQLGEEGDEYLPKEFDPSGEKKVDAMGYLQDGRTYRCRTFRVQNRGNKLFMLATECARVLNYRDSYLLFNKNRSLYKIIANQVEKDDLIAQDILPYSYRSRQIAIVTARSMFRQFGSRVIVNGRRVRDDYWESKAIKQGFTEEDLAGEKRPGAGKAREAAAAEAASIGNIPTLGHGDVIYSNAPQPEGLGQSPHALPSGLGLHSNALAPLPMINPAPSDDPRMREYGSMPRPRQEMTGQPYHDRTQSSTAAEIVNQASHTAEFSKILNQQRGYRAKGLEDHWHKPREAPVSDPQGLPSSTSHIDPNLGGASQTLQSPQFTGSGYMTSMQPHNLLSHQQPQSMLTPQPSYSQTVHQQAAISPSLRGVPQGIRPEQLHHRSPSVPLSTSAAPNSMYAYPQAQQQQSQPHQQQQQQQQLWGQPPPQPQQPPLSTSQPLGMQQYNQMHPQQSSPHLQQSPSHHPSQSPRHRNMPSPQLHSQPQSHQQNLTSLGYPGVSAMSAAARGTYSSSPSANVMPQFQAGAPQQTAVTMGVGNTLPGWPSTTGSTLPNAQPHPGSSQGGWPASY